MNPTQRPGSPATFTWTFALAALLSLHSACTPPVTRTTLTLTPANALLTVGQSQAFAVNATMSDGTKQAVSDATWMTGNASISGVSEIGVVTALTAGTTTVTATSGALTATANVTVTATTLDALSVTPSPVELRIDATQALTVTGHYGDDSTADLTAQATFTSLDQALATVDTAGVVTGVAPGSTTIKVEVGTLFVDVPVVVAPPALLALAIAPDPLILGLGGKKPLRVTGTFDVGPTRDVTLFATWTISSATIASVNSSGVVTALALGTTTATGTVTLDGVTRTDTVTIEVPGPLVAMDLPVTFDQPTTNDGLRGFEGAEDSTIVLDPAGGTNLVARVVKSATAAPWAGTTLTADGTLGFATRIPLTENATKMRLRTWSPVVGVKVRLKVEDHADVTVSVETDAFTTVANGWETLEFDFANEGTGTAALNPSKRYDKATVFFNYGVEGATTGARTYYFDDLSFVSGSGSTDGGTVDEPDAGEPVDAGPPVYVFEDELAAGVTFAPFDGSQNALDTVTTEAHAGTSSLRIEVPGGTAYTGGTLRAATPQDLSRFNAVTFWLKASKSAVLNVTGFGESTPSTSAESLQLPVGAAWRQFVIPIPGPAQLVDHGALFHFAEGPEDGAYNLFLDDLRYERLDAIGTPVIGNIGWPAARALGVGDVLPLDRAANAITWGAPVTTNGGNLSNVGFRYFSLTSSSPSVATISRDGVITAAGPGSATISATFRGTGVPGVTPVTVSAPLAVPTTIAAAPTADAGSVISLFSSTYTNVGVDTWRTDWSNCCNTLTDPFLINGHAVKKFELRHFVGIEFGVNGSNALVNASSMTVLHLDVWTPNGTELQVRLVNGPGPGQTESTVTVNAGSTPSLSSGSWKSLDIPLANFTALSGRDRLGQLLLLVPTSTAATFYVDNVYFRQ